LPEKRNPAWLTQAGLQSPRTQHCGDCGMQRAGGRKVQDAEVYGLGFLDSESDVRPLSYPPMVSMT
jgi:hypothetical protein